ncbi:MAG: hypothetical protein HQL24_07005 [Candidatus Omnitrophica bacterium]|nr:hypothetical protein [Candidatus Omnitrophota bacterium]
MKRILSRIYLITFVLSFCSIVYELILAQTLSAFLADTVLRYSVTVGLYLFSLGIGSLLAEGTFLTAPAFYLIIVEILLAVLGGFSIVFLFVADALRLSGGVFSFLAHGLIILIGILSGFEVPLLIALMDKDQPNRESLILGFNYLGAFLGTIAFAFIFYPRLGLIPSSLLVGTMNALIGILLFKAAGDKLPKGLFILQALLLVLMVCCLLNASAINDYFIKLYLR